MVSPCGRPGDSEAQFDLGVMYDEGKGVPQDAQLRGRGHLARYTSPIPPYRLDGLGA